ncbi:sugar MFS transporter [Paraburkholderia phenazinium]|uniref:sugar MFS transporter n=1 Tax=Paraburkholderia phenazinium TaxID=60549 RepID=UPI00158AF1B9|nr:sugar MFS transporter [Paraburkholderia phenazinium]
MLTVHGGGEVSGGSYRRPMTIIGMLYFVTGAISWLNGPLTVFVKLAFRLDDAQALLVTVVFYVPYFVFALPYASVLRRIGMKRGMAAGLGVMSIGALLFSQFVGLHSYPGVLSSLLVVGTGLSLMQTAYNPYISVLGPIDSAARRVAAMGICNKTAGILAPYAFAALVMGGVGEFVKRVKAAPTPAAAQALLNDFAARLHWPYLMLSVVLVVMAVFVARSSLPDIKPSTANATMRNGETGGSIFAFPHLWLGVLCIFTYIGAEVLAGDAIGLYGQNLNLPLDETRHFTSYTLFAMLVGYLVGLSVVPRVVSQQRYLVISALLAVLLSVGAYASQGYAAIAFIAALGFAHAMMWPAIFPLAIRGLGRFTETGSALLIMGIVGGAVMPQLFAHLKRLYDFQLVYMVLTVSCYLYIMYYGLRGHAVGTPLSSITASSLSQPEAAGNSRALRPGWLARHGMASHRRRGNRP